MSDGVMPSNLLMSCKRPFSCYKSRDNGKFRNTYLARMDYVRWWGASAASPSPTGFFVAARATSTAAAAAATTVNSVLQGTALGMGFWVVYFKPHLLEQGSHYRASARPNIRTNLSEAAAALSSTHCLFRCMGMTMAVVAVDVPMVVHGTATLLGLRTLDLQLLLFGYLLNGHEPLFAHLDSFCHVAHGRIFYMPTLDG